MSRLTNPKRLEFWNNTAAVTGSWCLRLFDRRGLFFRCDCRRIGFFVGDLPGFTGCSFPLSYRDTGDFRWCFLCTPHKRFRRPVTPLA